MSLRDVPRLLLINTGWTLALTLASNFLSAWFWDIGTGIVPIVTFYAILFAVMILCFGAAAKIPRHLPSSTLMATGIVLDAIFLGLMLLLRAHARHYYIPLAILDGTAASFYWLALYVLASSWVSPDQAHWYNSWTGTLEALLGLVVPPLSGWIIASMAGITGYRLIFAMALVSLIGPLWLILRAKSPNQANDAARLARTPSFATSFSWKALLWSFSGLGLRDGVYYFLPGLLLFVISHSTVWLGIFAASQSALQGSWFWVLGRWPTIGQWPGILWAGAVISLLALALLWLPLDTATLFALGMAISLAYPPFKVALESSALVAIRRAGYQRPQEMVRRTGEKEVWINSGRLLGLLLVLGLLLIVPHFRLPSFRWLLALWGISPIAILVTYRNARTRT